MVNELLCVFYNRYLDSSLCAAAHFIPLTIFILEICAQSFLRVMQKIFRWGWCHHASSTEISKHIRYHSKKSKGLIRIRKVFLNPYLEMCSLFHEKKENVPCHKMIKEISREKTHVHGCCTLKNIFFKIIAAFPITR